MFRARKHGHNMKLADVISRCVSIIKKLFFLFLQISDISLILNFADFSDNLNNDLLPMFKTTKSDHPSPVPYVKVPDLFKW